MLKRIPPGMLSVSFKGKNKSDAAIPALASRICFFSETQIRVMTKEGLDCILDYESMLLLSATAVDNVNPNDFDHPHFYFEMLPRKPNEVVKRLFRMCNKIKLFRAHTRKGFKYSGMTDEQATDMINMKVYQHMFTVDYLQQSSFAIELSFTALDWMIMMRIINDRTYDFNNITDIQRM